MKKIPKKQQKKKQKKHKKNEAQWASFQIEDKFTEGRTKTNQDSCA